MLLKAALAIGLAASAAACASPAKPSPIESQATPTPSTSPIAELRISGPTSILPRGKGTSIAQYTAMALHANGLSEDVTASASWRTSNVGIIYPTSRQGEMQAGFAGEATISATLGGITAQFAVLVMEPGTYRITGIVNAFTGGPLANARVKVLSGIVGSIPESYTEASGRYTFYGVIGRVELRATVEGFEQETQRADVTTDSTVNFRLSPLSEPADASGAWTVTFSASPGCRDNLYPEARDREYEATITQQSAQLLIRLTSPTLRDGQARDKPGEFSTWGTIFGNKLSFTIVGDTEFGTWSYPYFFDRFSSTHWSGMSGWLPGAVIGRTEIRGTMNGDIESWDWARSDWPGGEPSGVCRATDHVVVFRRH
jgi:hypothetical protein